MQEQNKPEQIKRRNSLLVYVGILFSVAFLLILLSFLIQLRNSNETISQLSQSSANAINNVETLQQAYWDLQSENTQLTAQVATLEAEKAALEDAAAAQAATQAALSEELQALQEELACITAELTQQEATARQMEEETQALEQELLLTAQAYELLLQAENYLRTGYEAAASNCLEELEAQGLVDYLGTQAASAYRSLPDRIEAALLPSTDSIE